MKKASFQHALLLAVGLLVLPAGYFLNNVGCYKGCIEFTESCLISNQNDRIEEAEAYMYHVNICEKQTKGCFKTCNNYASRN